MLSLFQRILVSDLSFTVILEEPLTADKLVPPLNEYFTVYLPLDNLIGKDAIPLLSVFTTTDFPSTVKVIFLFAKGTSFEVKATLNEDPDPIPKVVVLLTVSDNVLFGRM